MTRKLLPFGAGLIGAFALTSIGWESLAADTPTDWRKMSIEERATDCAGWGPGLGTALGERLARTKVHDGASTAFARSVPSGHKVSVYIRSGGCRSDRVNVAQALPLRFWRGAIYHYRPSPRERDQRITMYALIEIEPDRRVGPVRTFILAQKEVDAQVEIDSNAGADVPH